MTTEKMIFDKIYLELICKKMDIVLDGSILTFGSGMPTVMPAGRFQNPNMIMAIVNEDGVGIALDMSGEILIPAYMWYELLLMYEQDFHWLPSAALFKCGHAEPLRVSIYNKKQQIETEPAVIG